MIRLRGYQDLKPGESYRFVGKVTQRVLLGQVVRIEMMDPTFEHTRQKRSWGGGGIERIIMALGELRHLLVARLEKALPEPEASLGAGILLGSQGGFERNFYAKLVETGTLHLVAASGMNVMVVANVLTQGMSYILPRGLALAAGIGGIFFYVLLAGAGASVTRAGIMGGLALLSTLLGRTSEARRLLVIAAFVMLLVNPLLLLDVGWQLSVAATAGLLYLLPLAERLPKHPLLAAYLYPTLAATVATAPILYSQFGRVSLVGVVANMLILPVVPLAMLLSALAIAIPSLSLLAYVPLAWIVGVIEWLS